MRSTQNFTEGKILSPLILFALPVLLAIFLDKRGRDCDDGNTAAESGAGRVDVSVSFFVRAYHLCGSQAVDDWHLVWC